MITRNQQFWYNTQISYWKSHADFWWNKRPKLSYYEYSILVYGTASNICCVKASSLLLPKHHNLHSVHPWPNVTLSSSINRKQYITILSVTGIYSWTATLSPHCLIHSLLYVFCLTHNDQSCRKYCCLGTTVFAVCLLIPFKILSLPPWCASTDYFTCYFWSYWHIFKLCASHSQLLWYVSPLIPWHTHPASFSSSLAMQKHISCFPWSLSPQASQRHIPTKSSCVLTGKGQQSLQLTISCLFTDMVHFFLTFTRLVYKMNAVYVVYLDWTMQAFDKVSHDILMKKLER